MGAGPLFAEVCVTADHDVVRRFMAGDQGAVRELYREFARPMFAVAFNTLRNPGLAEEAVQQAFLQAWRAAASFDPRRSIAPWLYTITRRVAIDIYRRERRHANHDGLEHDVAELPPGFETAWTVWEVRKALDEMPSDERAVLEATHFLGLTHDQAAERLGVPVGTIKSRSHRAHRRMASLLAHLEEAWL